MCKNATAVTLIDDALVRVTRFDFGVGHQTGWHRHEYDYVITACGNLCYEINFFGIQCSYVTSEPREIKLGKYLQKKGFGKLFTKKNIDELFRHVKKDIHKKKYADLYRKKISYFRHNGLDNIYKLISKKFNEI